MLFNQGIRKPEHILLGDVKRKEKPQGAIGPDLDVKIFRNYDSVSSYSLDDRADSDGSLGFSFSSSEGEESDGDILLNPISDVDIPTSSERFRTPDDALTTSAQTILGRYRKKGSHGHNYLKCFITWGFQFLRKKLEVRNRNQELCGNLVERCY
ncbi:hypothetical protein Tco_0708056 [Tanacetum coccineum]